MPIYSKRAVNAGRVSAAAMGAAGSGLRTPVAGVREATPTPLQATSSVSLMSTEETLQGDPSTSAAAGG